MATSSLVPFQADLSTLTDQTLVQKYLMHGDCYALDNDSYFALKSEIASHFDVSPNEVIMVGSGKTGFSLSPKKPMQAFGDESDLDIAIISTQLFDKLWLEAYEFESDPGSLWRDARNFKEYLFVGWIRPDKFPSSAHFQTNWWDYLTSLTRSGRFGAYTIRAGVYRSWDFYERYAQRGVASCRKV